MIDWISDRPLQLVLFSIGIIVILTYLLINIRNQKKLFFAILFYIPLSFRSSLGTLSMYFIILLFFLSFLLEKNDAVKQKGNFDKLLIFFILIASILSTFVTEPTSLFVHINGGLRLSPKYLNIIVMFSNLAIYYLCRKNISSIQDIIIAIKCLIISGTIASLAAYLQFLNKGLFIFKYIVLAEYDVWSDRVAGTMQGYETLAEYTIILIFFSLLLFSLSSKYKSKIIYFFLIINFIIVLTLTKTRGIYIAAITSFLITMIILFLSFKFKEGFKLFIFGILIFSCLIVAIITIDQFRPNSNFAERIEKLKEIDISKGKLSTRTGSWESGTSKISKMTSVEKIFGAGFKYLFYGESGKERYQGWPHCLYFSYILRDGFFGFSLLLLFFVWLYKSILTSMIQSKNNNRTFFTISLVFHLIFLSLIIDQMKIEFIRQDRAQNLYWAIFSLMASYSYILKRQNKNKGGLI